MTQTTEQERAEFEVEGRKRGWNLSANKTIYNPKAPPIFESYIDPLTQARWESWQAARRAPVVPYSPCVICGSDEPYTGTCGSNDPRALCKKPAPQPPEATVNDLLTVEAAAPDVADIIAGELQTSRGNAYDLMKQALSERDADRALIEAAPVQLPEAWAVVHPDRVHYSETAWRGETQAGTKLYTEHQVRQLLAAQEQNK